MWFRESRVHASTAELVGTVLGCALVVVLFALVAWLVVVWLT